MQVSLSRLWTSLGVIPAAVVGHSMGEVAAACCAGGLRLEDGARIIATRSRLARRRSGSGKMLHVGLSKQQAEDAIRGFTQLVSVAVCSSPRSSVLSGDARAIEELEAILASRDVFCRQVRVDYASHSPQMDELMPELRQLLAQVRPGRCSVPMHSTVLGRVIADGELDAEYWANNLRKPVLFAERVQELARAGHTLFLEVSPHPVLVPAIEETLQAENVRGKVLGTLRREQGTFHEVLSRWCDLYLAGGALDFERSSLFSPGTPADLPLYPWDRGTLWFDPGRKTALGRAGARHALVHGALDIAARGGLRVVQTRLCLQDTPFLQDHCVDGAVVFPAAGFVDLVFASMAEANRTGEWTVEEMTFEAALTLSAEAAREVQITLEEPRPGSWTFLISSRTESSDEPWIRHSRGRVLPAQGYKPPAPPSDVVELRADRAEDYYAALRAARLEYGPAFQGVRTLHRGGGVVAGTVTAPEPIANQLGLYSFHPAQLDAAFQVALAGVSEVASGSTFVPVRIGRICRLTEWPERVSVVARRRLESCAAPCLDLWVHDEAGSCVTVVEGLEIAPLARVTQSIWQRERWFLEAEWQSAEPTEGDVAAGTFVIVDFGGASADLALHLERCGQRVQLLPSDDGPPRDLAAFETPDYPLRGVVLLTGSGSGDDGPRVERSVAYLAQLATSLAGLEGGKPLRLTIVTTGAVTGACAGWRWAALWGAGRVLDMECPELSCTRIDWSGEAASLSELAREIALGGPEAEQSFRNGQRFVSRLKYAANHTARRREALRQVRAASTSTPYRLETFERGALDSLEPVAAQSPELAPDRVRVAVDYAGVNFIDLMKIMGIYPGEVAVGECSGRVLALGSGVECDLQVGDPVAVTTDDAFVSHVDVIPEDVFKQPLSLDPSRAAGYLLSFGTAWYALHHLARITEQDRILIHSGAGGLGLSAIQLARRAGLEVFATAGTESKRALLTSLGVEHVFDSRSTAFAEQVRLATQGRGVDVVLNSLSGEKLSASLSCLAFNGRFIEVGKRDIYSDAQLSMEHFRKSIAFFAVDMASLRLERPALFRQVMEEVTEQFERGWLEPLPTEVFPLRAVHEAFGRMARAEHTGKIVVDMRAVESVGAVALPAGSARPEGTYVISGGLGALGKAAAEWLVARGARDIVLLSRSRPDAHGERWLSALRESGARVRALSCDVGSWPEVSTVFRMLREEGCQLRGVIHAAGILADATLQNVTLEQVERVFSPKVHGAHNLHRASEGAPLDFFVLYSSVASLLGSAGQAAYSAANACLDALARHRVASGLPATSVNWGPVADVGLAAAQAGRGDRLAARGLGPLSVDEVMLALEHVLAEGLHEVGVARLDMTKWRDAHPALLGSTRWSGLLSQADNPASSSTLRARLQNADAEGAQLLLRSAIRSLLSSVLRCPEERIGDSATFGSLGLDSLLGLELRARLSRELEMDLPATVLWRFPNVEKLARELWTRCGLERRTPEAAPDIVIEELEEIVTSTGSDLARDFDAELARAESLT